MFFATGQAVTAMLVVLACLGSTPVSSAPQLNPADLLGGGISLNTLTQLCPNSGTDFGPCLTKLIKQAIELARPNFKDGISIGGKKIILDPYSLKDINSKPGSKFQFSLKDLKVHGLSTISVNNIVMTPNKLGLDVSFEFLRATGDVSLRYSFIKADSEAEIRVSKVNIRVDVDWKLDLVGGKPVMKLTNPEVTVKIGNLSIKLTKLGGLGAFIQSIVNNNSKVLLEFLLPELEKQAAKLIEKAGTIKLGSI